mgnify:CR=1 FL=1
MLFRSSSIGVEGYVLESIINTIRDKWDTYQTQKVNAIIEQINETARKYNKAVELLNQKKQEYEKFNDKLNKISIDIKNQMYANTQTIEEQIGKSDNMETINKQLNAQNMKDEHLQQLSQTNSENYAQVERSERINFIIKLVISSLLLILTIWLAQRAVNLYSENF